MVKKYSIEKDFKLNVKSLKISCNFPEMRDSSKCYVMDVFTFLQELNVIDSRNKNTLFYYKLFDYSEEKDGSNPSNANINTSNA